MGELNMLAISSKSRSRVLRTRIDTEPDIRSMALALISDAGPIAPGKDRAETAIDWDNRATLARRKNTGTTRHMVTVTSSATDLLLFEQKIVNIRKV